MFKKAVLVSVLSALAVGAAFAQEATPAPELQNFKSTKTRAEVIAELKAARAAGELTYGEEGPVLPAAKSTKTRAEVIAELKAYIASGQRDIDARTYNGGF